MKVLSWLLLAGLLIPPAPAQQVTGPSAAYRNFGGNYAGSSGNGADLTEDILPTCSFTMPINAMPNVGDVWQVTLGGKFTGSTDTKAVRLRAGTTTAGPIVWTASAAAASNTAWVVVIKYMKTSFNAQNFLALANIGSSANAFSGTIINSSSLQETIVNNFVVTGQNSTNAVASSITCQYMQTEYFGAQ
jgi:hypothetical protein